MSGQDELRVVVDPYVKHESDINVPIECLLDLLRDDGLIMPDWACKAVVMSTDKLTIQVGQRK